MKIVNWLFTQRYGGTEVGRSRRDCRDVIMLVASLCDEQKAVYEKNILSDNRLEKFRMSGYSGCFRCGVMDIHS